MATVLSCSDDTCQAESPARLKEKKGAKYPDPVVLNRILVRLAGLALGSFVGHRTACNRFPGSLSFSPELMQTFFQMATASFLPQPCRLSFIRTISGSVGHCEQQPCDSKAASRPTNLTGRESQLERTKCKPPTWPWPLLAAHASENLCAMNPHPVTTLLWRSF